MKILVALALVAAVAAYPKPESVRLGPAPEPEVVQEIDQLADISMLPLIVPNDVVEAFMKELENAPIGDFVPEPINLDLPEDFDQFVHPLAYGGFEEPSIQLSEAKINPFEDFSEESAVADNAEEIIPDLVNFFELADEAAAPIAAEVLTPIIFGEFSDLTEEIVPSAVNFVNAPVDATFQVPTPVKIAEVADMAEEVVPTPVKIAEVADLTEEIAPSAVRFVNTPVDAAIPVPAPVNIAKIPDVAEKIIPTPVKIAEVADIAEESIPTPVKIAEVDDVAEEIAPSPVNFVNVPNDAVPVAAEIPSPVNLEYTFQDPAFAYPPIHYDNPMLR